MVESLRANWVILRTCIQERLTYRADFAFATFIRFLPIVTQVFLWGAIYKAGTGDEHQELNSYTYANMVAYYLLAMVARAFSSMPGLASGMARDVRDGTIKKFLTQPIDMLTYLLWARVAHKLVYYVVATLPFALLFYLCRGFFDAPPDLATVGAFGAALVMAFLIGFLLESLVGLLSFWFLEVSSLIFIFMMLNYFMSGHMVPLDWFPEPFAGAMKFLPFQYLAYFPATIMLQRYTPDQLQLHLLVELGWVVALFILNRIVFIRGIRRYSAFGG